MNEIEKLTALAAIQRVKARYYHALDRKDWTALKATLAPDLVADFRDAAGERNEALLFQGADKFIEGLAPVTTATVTFHNGYMPDIEVLSPTSARGVWAFEDHVWANKGSGMPFNWINGYGHSHDTYSLVNGEWVLQSIRLTRVREADQG